MLAIFNIFIILILTFVPMLNDITLQLEHHYNKINDQRFMYTVLQKYSKRALETGVILDGKRFKMTKTDYCMLYEKTNEKILCQTY